MAHVTDGRNQFRKEAAKGIPPRKLPEARHYEKAGTILALIEASRGHMGASLGSLSGLLDQNPLKDMTACLRTMSQAVGQLTELVQQFKEEGGWEAEYQKLNAEREAAKREALEKAKPVPTKKLIDKATKVAANKSKA